VRTLYNILFLLGSYCPRLITSGGCGGAATGATASANASPNYDTKLKQALTNRHSLWLHAVSVGEVGLCTQLIKALEPRLPNAKVVVSTTTTTGMGELKKRLPTHISKIYYPIDRRSYVARAQAVIQPEAIVLVEAEIWPNFIWRAQSQRIPLFLVNARVSERSYRGYKRFGFPVPSVVRRVHRRRRANRGKTPQRLREIGCRPEAVQVIGSLKFDAARATDHRTLNVPALLWQAGAKPGAPVLVCGSTHDGEEALLGEIFSSDCASRFPDLFLVLVPRHFERTREVERDLQSRGVKYILRSELTPTERKNRERRLALPRGEHDGRTEILLRARHSGLRRQKPHRRKAGRIPSNRAPSARRWSLARTCRTSRTSWVAFPRQRRRRAGERRGGTGNRFCPTAHRFRPPRTTGAMARAVVQQNLGAMDRTVEMILRHQRQRQRHLHRAKAPGVRSPFSHRSATNPAGSKST
jgi:hypothetical protein